MICNVTVLGGTDSASAMAGRIVNYLQGLGWSKSGASTDQVVSYYQSSVEGVGRWMGSGVAGLVYGGQVEATVLESLLAGVHPETGVELLSGVGMAGRGQTGPKDPSTQVESTGPSDEWLNRDQVAVLTGLSWSRVNKLCAAQTKFELDAKTFPVRHAQWVADQAQAVAVGAEFSTKEPKEPKEPTAFLKGQKSAAGEWEVQRGEVERFKAGHNSLETVVAYDITFSAPKSVSLTWALADASQRAVIEESRNRFVTQFHIWKQTVSVSPCLMVRAAKHARRLLVQTRPVTCTQRTGSPNRSCMCMLLLRSRSSGLMVRWLR